MAACKVGLRLASGKADFRRDQPHHSQNQEEWLKLLVQTLWFTLNTHFASGSLEQCYMAGRRCLWNLHPVKYSGHWVPSELPRVATVHVAGGNTNTPWDSTGRGLSAACAWFPPDFIPCTSFPCCFALCPFTVISHSHECDCRPNPRSPPSKSLTPRSVVGTPTRKVTNEHNQVLLQSTHTRLFSEG